MQRLLFFLSFCFLSFTFCSYDTINCFAAETPSSLYAKSAILMDGTNQRVLFGKDETVELPMASTTKIMTCLYALEHGNLSDTVTFSANAAAAPKVHLGASEGDQFLLSDLLYALMLESYNDVAIAIAEHIGGSVEAFCAAMTEEARNYGCYHTSFETPNGLDSPNHYTTCYDLAILTCRALQNDSFRAIIQETSYSIKELNSGQSYSLYNKDSFLSSYPGAIGVKTGYTSGAGYCFVGAVESEDRLLISVVLGSGWYPNRNYKWSDTKKLMDYGMENYTLRTLSPSEQIPLRLPVIDGQSASCSLGALPNITLLLRDDEIITWESDVSSLIPAPVQKEENLGTLSMYIDQKIYRSWPVQAQTAVKKIDYAYCLRALLQKMFF